jgi:hypothetical protein
MIIRGFGEPITVLNHSIPMTASKATMSDGRQILVDVVLSSIFTTLQRWVYFIEHYQEYNVLWNGKWREGVLLPK